MTNEQVLYTLSQTDVDAYLATKQENETVGTTCFCQLCLLAQVLRHKYATEDVSVNGVRAWVHGVQVIEDEISIEDVAGLFDALRPSALVGGYPVTKRQWLNALKEAR